jgi:hypothetical protein
MPSIPPGAVRIMDVSNLNPGDTVEARSLGAVLFAGEIELVAPHLGVLWIRQGSWQDRKLLDPTEYELWKR